MRLALISCEIFYREMCAAIAHCTHRIDVTFLPKGLHDIGQDKMMPRLQMAIDQIGRSCENPFSHAPVPHSAGHAADCPGKQYDAVLLGYGLCNNGIAGLTARAIPLVIPRAHDCITLFFGSRRRYQAYFDAHPGTFFETTGWLERGQEAGELQQISIPHLTGMDMSYDQLVARFGEDNAKFLYDTLCDTTRHYTNVTFIRMGIEPDERFEQQARAKADEHGWTFDQVPGDMNLFHRLLNGSWDDADFLVVPPGYRVAVKLGEAIIHAEPAG